MKMIEIIRIRRGWQIVFILLLYWDEWCYITVSMHVRNQLVMTSVADIFIILPLFAKLSPSLNSSKIWTTHPQRKVRNLSNCSQLVHDLFKTCSWLVPELFTTCLCLVHDLFILVHYLFMTWNYSCLLMTCPRLV